MEDLETYTSIRAFLNRVFDIGTRGTINANNPPFAYLPQHSINVKPPLKSDTPLPTNYMNGRPSCQALSACTDLPDDACLGWCHLHLERLSTAVCENKITTADIDLNHCNQPMVWGVAIKKYNADKYNRNRHRDLKNCLRKLRPYVEGDDMKKSSS